MKICYDNEVMNATITSFSENPYYLFSDGLKDSRLSRVGRTLAVSSQWIKFAFPVAVSADSVLIANHNLTAGASVKLEGNASDVWTSPALSVTLTPDSIVYSTFSSASYQYWRITVNDVSNTDGFIQIGSVFLGDSLTMPGFDTVGTVFGKSSSSRSISVSGQAYGQKRLIYKVADINFPDVSSIEKIAIETFIETVDTTDPFWLIIWENDTAICPPVYMILDDYPELKKNAGFGLTYNTSMKMREVF